MEDLLRSGRRMYLNNAPERQRERQRRNILLTPQDAAMQESQFLDAPYVHQCEPKYHALLLRAAEYAKRHKKYCLWFRAHDTILDKSERPKDPLKLQKKKERLLQRHDQQTKGIPCQCPLFEGLKMCVTEKNWNCKHIIFLKHTSCEAAGWKLNSLGRVSSSDGANPGERFLDYLAEVPFRRCDVAGERVARGCVADARREPDVDAEQGHGARSPTPWTPALARLCQHNIYDSGC